MNTKGLTQEDIASHGMDHSLDLLSDTYNYNHWIYSLLRPYIGSRVLEIGSGCGNISRFLLNVDSLVCLEPLEEYIEALNRIAVVHTNVRVLNGIAENLTEIDGGLFDSMVCINVLEHIKEDGLALKEMYDALQPGGHLIMFVPACQWAYGEMDRELKHFRRYNKSGLNKQMLDQGFRIMQSHYVNFIGVFGWWWAGRIMKETVIDVKKAKLVDRLVPYLSAVERLVHPICGQSVFVVAQK